MNIKQKFKVYCSTNINDTVNKELVHTLTNKEQPLILEAVASSNNIDLDGDYMTNECLEDMKNQALGLSIFLDHEHTIDKIVGRVTEVIETSSDIFKIKFSVLPKYEWYITDLLNNDINLGLSIGASVLDFEETDTGWKIDKVKLVEISIVGIPANWDTFGTVQTSKELGMVTAKCFNGACKQIIDDLNLSEKGITTKDIEDGEEPDEDGVITEKEVIDLINEACIRLKSEIITEIVAEFNLDGKRYEKPTEEPQDEERIDFSEEDLKNETDSSEEDEDKEKSLDMEKEEIMELIKEHSLTEEMIKEVVVETLKELKEDEVTETPIIKEGETELSKEKEIEEETEEETEEEDKDKEKSSEEKEDEDEDEDDEEMKKSSEEKSEKSFKDVDIESLKKSIREEIEGEILKSLSTEREPVAHEQPNVEEKEATEEKIVEKNNNIMSAREMAEHLLR